MEPQTSCWSLKRRIFIYVSAAYHGTHVVLRVVNLLIERRPKRDCINSSPVGILCILSLRTKRLKFIQLSI